jgi:hypothetical protein
MQRGGRGGELELRSSDLGYGITYQLQSMAGLAQQHE